MKIGFYTPYGHCFWLVDLILRQGYNSDYIHQSNKGFNGDAT
jgi:hypothetical protein